MISLNIRKCLILLKHELKYRLIYISTYSPAELQFYTSIASIVVQIPASIMLVDMAHAEKPEIKLLFYFVLNGLFFHFQSITAYVLMDYISPVAHR